MEFSLITVLALSGTVVLFGVVFVVLFRQAYVTTPINKAFVRTGGFQKESKPLVVKDGGALVFASLHQIHWVDLESLAIEIDRSGDRALLTADPHYVELRIVFHIRVGNTLDDILLTARTIGGEAANRNSVQPSIAVKLDGALRETTATFDLMTLHTQCHEFIEQLGRRVAPDLRENGLIIDDISLLSLKVAEQGSFNTDNLFGAQAAQRNAEIIEQARIRRLHIEKEAEQELAYLQAESQRRLNEIERETELRIHEQNEATRLRIRQIEQETNRKISQLQADSET